MSTTKTTILDLPNELSLEIANYLKPKDYISLYRTCKSVKDVLKIDLGKKFNEHKRDEFKEFAKEYMNIKLSEKRKLISIVDFDYFSYNNDYFHDGITKSFKLYYESLRGPLTVEKYKELLKLDVEYDIVNRSFRWLRVNIDTFYLEDEISLYNCTADAEFRELAYKIFIYRMKKAFSHQVDEEFRKFMRKPSKPRKN